LLSTTTTTGEAKQSANPVSGTSGEDQEAQKCEPEDEEGSVYEPIDVSVPFPPRRTKRHIKGTRTESPQRNIYKRGPLTGTDAVPQGGVPSSTRQSSRARTPSAAAKSIPGKGKREDGVEGKLSTLNIEEDEGGVDEYVDMDYRAEKGESVSVRMSSSSERAALSVYHTNVNGESLYMPASIQRE
jgi:hypothetical protein